MRHLLLFAGLCLVLPAAAEVYRWTDNEGRVHYGERPPPQGADTLDLPGSGGAPPAGDADAALRRERQRRLLDAFDYGREQKKAGAAREARQREADAERCRALQLRWRQLSHGGPIYFERPDGGRDYLNDERREAEKAGMRPAYVRACGQEP